MWRVGIRNLIGHKMRLATTGLAVVIGVAFLTGTLVLRDTMTKTFDDLFAGVYAGTDALVRSGDEFQDPSGFGVQRGRIDEELLATVQDVEGVAAAQWEVAGYAQVVGSDGKPVGNPSNGPPTVGANWGPVDELNPWNLIAGRAPERDDDVVLDRKTAEVAGYQVGDSAQVLVLGPPRTVRISGIAEFGEGSSTGGASFVLFTTETAQEVVGERDKVDGISVVADDGVSEALLVANLSRVLPEDAEAVTGAVITAENQDTIKQGLSVFNTFMLVFALIALFVGAYIVFNTFFITVAQRARENALLRAIGASQRQVVESVLLEALGVGIVASALGVAAGVGVAGALKALLVAVGLELPVTGIVFAPATAITGVAAGLVVTMGAAIAPARRAGHVPPMAALRLISNADGGYGSATRVAVGFAILVAGGATLAYGLVGGTENSLAFVGGGGALVFVAVTVLGRTIALPLSRVIGWPIAHFRGIAGRLALENALRNPRRTASTASALMIGVGLVSFISIFAASTKASMDNTIDEKFR